MDQKTPIVNIYNSFLIVILMGLVIFAPLARGAVHLWAASVILVFASGALAVMIAKSLKEKVPVFPRTPVSSGLAGMAGLAFVSILFSSHKALGVEGLVMFLAYVVIFHAVVIVTENRRFERGLVYVIVGMGFWVSLVGLLKWAGFNPFFWWEYPEMGTYKEAFVTGVYVNQNHLAGYLEMTIPMTMILFVTRYRRLEKKFILSCMLLVMFIAFVLTFSRGGMISLVVGMGFLFLVLAFSQKFERKRSVLVIVVCALVAGGMLLAATPVVDTVSRITGAYPEESLEARVRTWSGTVKMIKAAPMTGQGPNSFAISYPAFQVPGLPVLSRKAHNDYLQIVSELGIFSLPLIGFLLYRFFVSGLRELNYPSRQRRGMTLGAMAGVLAILVHSFFHFNLFVPANAILFTVLSGIASSRISAPNEPSA